MNVEQLAVIVIDACEAERIGHMLTGAFASSLLVGNGSYRKASAGQSGYRLPRI